MNNADNFTHTVQWGHTGGELHAGQLSHDANKIYYDGGWQIAQPAEHNHNNSPSYFTYNDDSVKMDKIVEIISDMLAALNPVIDIGSMKKISDKLVKLQNAANQWKVYQDFGSNYGNKPNYSNSKPKEQQIKLEEDLFEI